MALSREALSGATTQLPIVVVSTTSGAANTIHTGHATAADTVWLFASNIDTVSVNLTIMWGDGNDFMTVGIPSNEGLLLVIPGLDIGTTKIIKAYASVASKINIKGHVERVS